MSFTVTIVRHAETESNRNNFVHSYSDGRITDIGVLQAHLLGEQLANEKFTKVYSSDMERTQDTAQAIFSKLNHPVPDIILDKKLREKDFGEWEGLPNQQILAEAQKEGLKFLFRVIPPGGESHQQTMERVVEFFQELCETCDNSTEPENILIVTHGIWIIYLLLLLLQNKKKELIEITGLDESCLNVENMIRTGGGPKNTCKTQLTIHKLLDNNNSECKRKIEVSSVLDTSHLNEAKLNN